MQFVLESATRNPEDREVVYRYKAADGSIAVFQANPNAAFTYLFYPESTVDTRTQREIAEAFVTQGMRQHDEYASFAEAVQTLYVGEMDPRRQPYESPPAPGM